MWKEFNANPSGKRTEDCAIRAVAKALDIDWKSAFAMITAEAYAMTDMPHKNSVWGAVLKKNGFTRQAVPNTCPECYTAAEFAEDHPTGVYVLGFGSHTATVKDGILYDSWDSSQEIPMYYWYRKE